MKRQQALEAAPSPAQQPLRRGHRVYTVAQILDLLSMSRRTFFRLRAAGQLPFLSEVEPRAGRLVRYRADLVDRYLDGQWNRSRFFTFAGRKVG